MAYIRYRPHLHYYQGGGRQSSKKSGRACVVHHKGVGEEITELDDKRDVLYAYTWYAVRTGEIGSWLLNEDLHKSQLKLSLDQTASIWAEVVSKEPDCVSSELTFA